MKILARNRRALSVVIFSGTTLASIVAVNAQEAASTTVLAPIVVNGGSEDPTAPIKGYVAKTSISATKTGTPLVETPQSISVVTANEIAAQGAQTLGQALGYTPGVVSEPYGSDPRFDSPLIRGFDGRQVQFLNGLRLMRTAGASAFDPYMLERIEVVRGPASVMFGQGNPGGLINMISKRPTFEKFGEIGVQAGSYDTYGTYFDFGVPVAESDQFAYRLTGMVRKAGTQTDYLDNDRYFIAPAFTWKPDEDTKLTILTSFQHDNQARLRACHRNLRSIPRVIRCHAIFRSAIQILIVQAAMLSILAMNLNTVSMIHGPSARMRAFPIKAGNTKRLVIQILAASPMGAR